MSMMTPEQILQRAADILRKEGWMPHASLGPGQPMCMVEAVMTAAIRSDDFGSSAYMAMQLLRNRLKRETVSDWNDRQTTIEPVLAVLEGR